MENNSSEYLYYDSVILVVPSGRNKKGKLLSQLYQSDDIVEFVDNCIDALALYSPDVELVILDAAESNIDFESKKNVKKFLQFISEKLDTMYLSPLYINFAIDTKEHTAQAIALSKTIKSLTNSTVAVFNIETESIQKVKKENPDIDIVAGKSSHSFHLSNIISNNVSGCLYGTYDIIPNSTPYSL